MIKKISIILIQFIMIFFGIFFVPISFAQTDRTQVRKLYIDGDAEQDQKKYGIAKDIFQKLTSDPLFGDDALFRLISIAKNEGDEQRAVELSEQFIQLHAGSSHRPTILLQLITYFSDRQDVSRAKYYLSIFESEFPNYYPAGLDLARASLLQAGGNCKAAQELYAKVIFEQNDASARYEAEQKAIALECQCSRIAPSPAMLMDLIDQAIASKDYSSVIRHASDLNRIYPKSDEALIADYKMLWALKEARRAKDSSRLYKEMMHKTPKTKESITWAWIVKALFFNGKESDERKLSGLLKAADMNPNTLASCYAQFIAGKTAFEMNSFDQSASLMDKVIQNKGMYRLHSIAAYYAGLSYLITNNPQRAAVLLKTVINSTPNSRNDDANYYFLGRAMEKSNNRHEAIDAYRLVAGKWSGSYYALAAERRLVVLGVSLDAGNQAAGNNVPTIDPKWAQIDGSGQNIDLGATAAIAALKIFAGKSGILIDRAREYNEMGRPDLAKIEIDELSAITEKNHPANPFLISVLYSLINENLEAIWAANRANENLRKGLITDPEQLISKRQYPLLFKFMIFDAAKIHGVDPYLVMAIAKQESGFQIKACSRVGARGLMQVMPSTGKLIARKRGIGKFTPAILYDPATSLDFGVWYFRKLLDGNGGDAAKSLAGYNAGNGRAIRWWSQWYYLPMDILIELIPLSETRGYVQTCLRNWEIYRRLNTPTNNGKDTRTSVMAILDGPPKSFSNTGKEEIF